MTPGGNRSDAMRVPVAIPSPAAIAALPERELAAVAMALAAAQGALAARLAEVGKEPRDAFAETNHYEESSNKQPPSPSRAHGSTPI